MLASTEASEPTFVNVTLSVDCSERTVVTPVALARSTVAVSAPPAAFVLLISTVSMLVSVGRTLMPPVWLRIAVTVSVPPAPPLSTSDVLRLFAVVRPLKVSLPTPSVKFAPVSAPAVSSRLRSPVTEVSLTVIVPARTTVLPEYAKFTEKVSAPASVNVSAVTPIVIVAWPDALKVVWPVRPASKSADDALVGTIV